MRKFINVHRGWSNSYVDVNAVDVDVNPPLYVPSFEPFGFAEKP